MTIAGEQCRASLMSRRFADAGAFARAIRDAGVDYVPLGAGRYEAHLPAPQRGSLVVRRAADRAHITQDAVDPDRPAMLLPIRSPAGLNINDWSVGRRMCSFLRPEAGFMPSVPLPAIGRRTRFRGGSRLAARPRRDAVHATPRQTDADCATEARGVAAPGRHHGHGSCDAAAGSGGGDRPLGHPGERTCGAGHRGVLEGGKVPLRARVPRNAIRLVGAGEDFLRANITRPIYTDELCKALAVSPRKLHHAFVAVCGVSPQAYLKRRRLMIVHQALCAGGPDAPLVKSVALAHGFWHRAISRATTARNLDSRRRIPWRSAAPAGTASSHGLPRRNAATPVSAVEHPPGPLGWLVPARQVSVWPDLANHRAAGVREPAPRDRVRAAWRQRYLSPDRYFAQHGIPGRIFPAGRLGEVFAGTKPGAME